MASKITERSISKFDVETLFRDVFTLEQIKQVGNLLKILGLYVFVERQQLDVFAERHYAQRIGLSYLRLAVKYNLITELQSDDDYKKYYFQLKSGGYYFLDSISFPHRKLPLDAAVSEREKLLAINNFLIENSYKLTGAPYLFEPLFTFDKTLLIHKIDDNDLDIKKLATEKNMTAIKKMYLSKVTLSTKAKGNLDSMM